MIKSYYSISKNRNFLSHRPNSLDSDLYNILKWKLEILDCTYSNTKTRLVRLSPPHVTHSIHSPKPNYHPTGSI